MHCCKRQATEQKRYLFEAQGDDARADRFKRDETAVLQGANRYSGA